MTAWLRAFRKRLQIDLRCPDAERFDGNTQPSCLASHLVRRISKTRPLIGTSRRPSAVTKMSTVLFHHFDFRSVADHLPLLCFVQHSSQRPQSAIGIRDRAWKFRLLSEISRDLVDSQTRNGCRFE